MKTKQCFYLIAHCIEANNLVVDKIFLQKYEAVKYGRKLATNNTNILVYLYEQEITRKGTLDFVTDLKPFEK